MENPNEKDPQAAKAKGTEQETPVTGGAPDSGKPEEQNQPPSKKELLDELVKLKIIDEAENFDNLKIDQILHFKNIFETTPKPSNNESETNKTSDKNEDSGTDIEGEDSKNVILRRKAQQDLRDLKKIITSKLQEIQEALK